MTPKNTEQMDEQVVRRAPLFTALDDAAASALRSAMQTVKIKKGEDLFKEGDDGHHLYVIIEGKIKLGTKSVDGRENLLSVLGPGEMFGELSLFDPGPRTSTATAVTDARLLSLGHNQVIPWVKDHPEVSLQLLGRLAQRLRRTNEAVGDLVFSDVPGRVAKALIEQSFLVCCHPFASWRGSYGRQKTPYKGRSCLARGVQALMIQKKRFMLESLSQNSARQTSLNQLINRFAMQ